MLFWPQPSETVGMPRAVSQLASRPAVGDGEVGSAAVGFDGGCGGNDRRILFVETERVVVEVAVEADFSTLSTCVADLLGGFFEGLFDLADDTFSEGGVVAAGFDSQTYAVSHDVGGCAAFDDADIAGAAVASLFDQPVPARFGQGRRWLARQWQSR